MIITTWDSESLWEQNIKLHYNDYLWERNIELCTNECVWKRNIELHKLNNSSPKYSYGKGRWRELITGNNRTTGNYFIPDKNIYLNLKNPESKKEYIYLFLVCNDEIYKKKFPLQNEEKELILYHIQNENREQIFIIDCFTWASYFKLIEEKEIFFNQIDNFTLNLVIYLCKTNDEFYFKKLINYPKFTDHSDIFVHVCAHANNFSMVELLIDKKFDNQQSIIDDGVIISIYVGNNDICRELIRYTSSAMSKFIEYAIEYSNFQFISILVHIDENSKLDFVKKMIDIIIKNEDIEINLLRIFVHIIRYDNFFNGVVDNDSDLLKIILCIIQYDILTCNLLTKLINLSSNTIQDYNEVFKKILKYDIDFIINIYEIIPIEFNKMNSTTKQMYIEYIENINFDHTYRGKYENILKLINIIGDLNYIIRKKITKDILEYLFYKVNLETLNIKIQILKYLIGNNSWIMKLIENKQEEIYSNNCGDKNFKNWVDNFPIKSDELINVLKKSPYILKNIIKNIPIRNILGDKYITFIYNEMIRIVNSKFILFDQIHVIGTNIDINEKECIELIQNISNYELDENINTNLFVCILKLRFYNFNIEINNNLFLANLQRKIIYDWCMRQYIVHNLNATIIWRCIFNFFTIERKYILFFDFAKKDLNKDIALNVCLITQLMEFWENKDEKCGIDYDYQII